VLPPRLPQTRLVTGHSERVLRIFLHPLANGERMLGRDSPRSPCSNSDGVQGNSVAVVAPKRPQFRTSG
jgi:hypothetical protein